jgi:CHAT domain-containing protein
MRGKRLTQLQWLWLIVLLFLFPLKDSQPASAQNIYDHAWRLFQSGYLALSQQEAASEFERYRSSDQAWAAKFQLLEANSMLQRGMYEGALGSLANYSTSVATDGAVEALVIEAVASTRQQQISAATQRLAQAESICANHDFPACGDLLAARAILAAKLGQSSQSRQFFLQALTFARGHGIAWQQVIASLNLGYTAMQADQYDESVDWSRAAYQSAVDLDYENLAQVAEGNLGWAYYQLGDDDRALVQFLAAEKVAERLGNIRYQLKWLTTAGYVYHDSGDLLRAAQSYRQALDLAREIESREDIVNALQDLAYISVTSGDLNAATSYVNQVEPMETSNGGRLSDILRLTKGKLAATHHDDARAEALFRSVENDPSSLMTTKLSAGIEIARILEAENNIVSAEREYESTLASYERARTQLKNEESQLPFGTNAAQIYDRYIQLLIREGRAGAALAVADQSRAQTLEQNLGEPGSGRFKPPAALNGLEIARKTDSTLLFYWLGDAKSYLWAITPSKTQLFTLPTQHEIATRVEGYRKALLDLRDPVETANTDGQALYKMLFAPAAALIRPGAQVIILADGVLSQLNFETLLVPGSTSAAQTSVANTAPLHYLLEDFTFSSAPSLAMLGTATPATDSNQRMLLFGNPVSPSQDFLSLPMFGFEMSRIETHFSAAQLSVFAGPNATPTAYVASQPRQYAYIHFVSHAVASQTNPLDSAIILSNPAGEENDFKLYAREIIRHAIEARLVTISACYGSGTRAYAGEGLVGLSWAFLRAGAQRVIGALWEVSDDSTPQLMDKLYQNLSSGQTPALALRNAKLALLHSGNRFRMPYYWAPFELYSRR